mmetsp:Transcript_52005/g.125459  ORF Transcript_52005/g.125459 Transcript_52005/m.125459 type:complete len:1141 (+) Transcript_52005:91-3513(+)
MGDESSSPLPAEMLSKPMLLGLHDDEDCQEWAPRRFLRLPSGHLLAYGGNTAIVTCLFEPPKSDANDNNDNHSSSSSSRFVVVQHYDDAVRAVAVSDDGKRLAVGLDGGSSKIYVFDDYSHNGDGGDDDDDDDRFHPFIRTAMLKELKKHRKAMHKKKNGNNDDPLLEDEEDYDDDDDFEATFDLSQSFQAEDLTYFAGPNQELPIRDMVFLPTKTQAAGNSKGSSSWDGMNGEEFDDTYMLAVASESGVSLVSATTEDDRVKSNVLTTTPSSYFETELKERHHNSGIRGMALTKSGDGDESNSDLILATLSMDGFLCLWDMNVETATRQGESNYKFNLYRESTSCIPRKDVGEYLDADEYDRSCRPIIHGGGNQNNTKFLVTPGKLYPTIRSITSLNNNNSTKKVVVDCFEDSIFKSDDDGGVDGNDNTNMADGHLESTVASLFCSPNVLITSGRDSRIVVWTKAQKDGAEAGKSSWTVSEKLQSESPVTDFCIHNQSLLFAACSDGYYQTFNVEKYIAMGGNSATVNKATSSNDSSSSSPKKNSTLKRISKKTGFDDSDDDDDHDFKAQTTSPSKTNSPGTATASKGFIDDEAEDSDDDGDHEKNKGRTEGEEIKDATNTTPSKGVRFADDEDLEDYDMPHADDGDDDVIERAPSSYTMGRRLKIVEPQAPFSPSATPLSLLRRYLCWNNIGSITVHQGDDRNSTIDIQFTDVNSHRPISFTDNSNFIIGSLGEDGAIFASDLKSDDDDDDDDLEGLDDLNMSERTKQAVRRDRKNREAKKDNTNPTGSTIYFHRFETFSAIAQKDWVVTLPDGERALGAATGEGWAAVVTSRRFLRFFSTGGSQGQLVWLEGEPVCMAGRGRYLAVFYHKSAPFAENRTQQLGYTLWDAKDFNIISEGSVPCLGEGSILEWVGFDSDCGMFAMDSGGMLSMLVPASNGGFSSSRSWKWAPVLDTVGLRKSSDDHHWPVTVYDGKLICVPLKGGNKYPDAARRPVTTSLSMRMPLARSVIAKTSTMEELSVRSNMALAQQEALDDMDNKLLRKAVDKVTIKLFAALAEAGKQEAALELTDRLHLSKSHEVCMKYADRLGQTKLADKINERFESDLLGNYPGQTASSSPVGGKRKNVSPDQYVAKRGRV